MPMQPSIHDTLRDRPSGATICNVGIGSHPTTQELRCSCKSAFDRGISG
jgi:hypothetical protein